MISFPRLSLLGLTVILASSCVTLERLVPNEQAEVENQAQERALPDSVTLINESELKERELNLLAKKNSTSKEENTELKQKILSLEAQLLRQEQAFAELKDQWTTNFSLMEKAVSETLRENQQLIAELQQSVEAMPNNMVASEQPQVRQALTPPQVTKKPSTPKLPTSPKPQATAKPPSIPVVEEVSLASLQQKPKPPLLPEVNTLIQKEEQKEMAEQTPPTNPALAESTNGSQPNAAEVIVENKLNTVETFEDPDLKGPVQPLALQRRPGIKKLYNQGMSAFIKGDYAAALNVFEGFVEEFDDDVDSDNAYYWIGYSQFKLGKWDAAESAFRKVLQNYEHRPTSQGFKTPDAIYMLGKLADIRKRPDRAAYYFRNVLENYPGSAAANNAQEELRALR